MADLRISGGVPAPLPAQPNEAVRAAQRAFFQAALNAAQPVATIQPVQARQTPGPSLASTGQQPGIGPQAEPQRYARPGSLLDIKV